MVSKLRCDSLQCHNHDFVEVALDMRQTGEEAAMSEMEIVYKLDSRPPMSKSSPSRFPTYHVLEQKPLLNLYQNCPTLKEEVMSKTSTKRYGALMKFLNEILYSDVSPHML
ncbi:hypothetical protein Tco_1104748 [Tanacetum coccineum]